MLLPFVSALNVVVSQDDKDQSPWNEKDRGNPSMKIGIPASALVFKVQEDPKVHQIGQPPKDSLKLLETQVKHCMALVMLACEDNFGTVRKRCFTRTIA